MRSAQETLRIGYSQNARSPPEGVYSRRKKSRRNFRKQLLRRWPSGTHYGGNRHKPRAHKTHPDAQHGISQTRTMEIHFFWKRDMVRSIRGLARFGKRSYGRSKKTTRSRTKPSNIIYNVSNPLISLNFFTYTGTFLLCSSRNFRTPKRSTGTTSIGIKKKSS